MLIRYLTLLVATTASLAGSFEQDPSEGVVCTGSSQANLPPPKMLGELLPRVVASTDSTQQILIKKLMLQYLLRSNVFLDAIKCRNRATVARLLQEDEDDGDDGGGGGGGGAGGAAGAAGGAALDNANVLVGVRRILANVFTGNLVGIIQESVGLRSPEGVTNVFTDVLSTLFGSQATAGVTGIVANLTTTAKPETQNASSITNTYTYNQYYVGGASPGAGSRVPVKGAGGVRPGVANNNNNNRRPIIVVQGVASPNGVRRRPVQPPQRVTTPNKNQQGEEDDYDDKYDEEE